MPIITSIFFGVFSTEIFNFQEAIHELIATEKTYIDDLLLVIEVSCCCQN